MEIGARRRAAASSMEDLQSGVQDECVVSTADEVDPLFSIVQRRAASADEKHFILLVNSRHLRSPRCCQVKRMFKLSM